MVCSSTVSSPYDENWNLDLECLALEIRLNDPRTTSLGAKELGARPRDVVRADAPVLAEVSEREIDVRLER